MPSTGHSSTKQTEWEVTVITRAYTCFSTSKLVISFLCFIVGLIEDGMAAMSWIRTRISNAPVFIWGHSLGSG